MQDYPNLTKKAFYKKISKEDATNILSGLLPSFHHAQNVEGSNFRNFLKGVSLEIQLLTNFIATLGEDFAPAFSEFFIEKWEEMVGIPDSCLSKPDNLKDRQALVIAKMSLFYVQTVQDYIDLALFLGYKIKFRWGNPFNIFPYQFPFIFGNTEDNLFTVYIDVYAGNGRTFSAYPYEFPFMFGSPVGAYSLQCIFNKIKPAHINFIYTYINSEI